MRQALAQPLLENRLDVHDRKQFELKLEYQPSGTDSSSAYFVDTWMFIPAQLNITPDTYPRESFYSDIHNYVRLKTPTLDFDEILDGAHSPLVQLEERVALGLQGGGGQSNVIYDAKMLSCVFRGVCRRFSKSMNDNCAVIAPSLDAPERAKPGTVESLDHLARTSIKAVQDILRRYRTVTKVLAEKYPLDERTKASFRLVDEYMSLTVEQFFRKTVVEMDQMPRSGLYVELRKELMAQVVNDESYRKDHKLRSVISPTGDNEEYTHRVGFLKKFCMNILFLKVRRASGRRNWEEVLFAIAAGLAMAFATSVLFVAQNRIPQASLNFFLVLVVGYMFKDRIKEGARRVFSSFAARHLFDRTTRIMDPVTQDRVGVCKEKVDYAPTGIPDEVQRLRRTDDFITVSQGELAETVIRYQKKIILDSDMLPRLGDDGIITGVTDIIRLNIDRLLRDMDDPESAMEYVDLEDFTVNKVKAAKSYQLDLAFRFSVDDGKHKHTTMQLVRLVLDRNGIKRMLRFAPEQLEGVAHPLRPV